MTNTAKALDQFFNSFGIPAFVEYSVPETITIDGNKVRVKPPYITYQQIEPAIGESASMYARVWYRSIGFEAINAKTDEIGAAIGAGVSIPTDNGCVWLYKDRNWAQNQSTEGDDTLKVKYLSLIINALTD